VVDGNVSGTGTEKQEDEGKKREFENAVADDSSQGQLQTHVASATLFCPKSPLFSSKKHPQGMVKSIIGSLHEK